MSQSSAVSKAKYRENNREKIRIRNLAYYHALSPVRKRKWYVENRRTALDRTAIRVARWKLETLTHYGKNGALQCCGEGCSIVDIDMLTLDHIDNNGAAHRKVGFTSGAKGFNRLKKIGYPQGFQTLCWNHQWKKEIARLKQRRQEGV